MMTGYSGTPLQSVFHGTGLNLVLYRHLLYCQHTSNYKNSSNDLSLYALYAELG